MTYRYALLGTTLLFLAGPALAGTQTPSYVPDLLPPNPTTGQCYARVEIPAQYESTTERVVTTEAHKRLHVQQPQLRSRTEKVMVKEPSVRYIVRQPTYSTVTRQVMTRPGYDKLSVSQPHFKSVTETVQTGASRLVWKRGNPAKLRAQGYIVHSTADGGVGGRGYSSTTQYGQTGGSKCGPMCEIWCLVEEPGSSVTVNRKVMTSPGQVRRIPVPPAYQSISQQIVSDPGGVQEVPVPGEFQSIEIQEIVNPGGHGYIEVPAEYGQVQGRRLISESRYEWRRVVCKPGTSVPAGRTSYQSSSSSVYQPSSSTVQSSSHTVGQTYHKTTTHSSRQGSLTVPQPTYSQRYSNGYPAGHALGQSTVQSPAYKAGYQQGTYVTGETSSQLSSSGLPNRAYTGPAYTVGNGVKINKSVVYDSRSVPVRTRR